MSTTVGPKRFMVRLLAVLVLGTGVLGLPLPSLAATDKYVEVGMPFTGKWGSVESGNPTTHTTQTGTHLWGNWAEDLFVANAEHTELDVKLKVASPMGGAITFHLESNSGGSCAGRAGWNVKYKVKLDGVHMGTVGFAHLNNVTTPTAQNGWKVGSTKYWQPDPVCGGWQVSTAGGTHTHFEMKSDTGNTACWTNHTLGGQLAEGTMIGKLGKTSATANGEQCSTVQTPTPPVSDGTNVTTAAGSNGNVHAFWRGANNNLWQAWFGNGQWHGPIDLGMGPLGSAPAVTVRPNGEVHVFWRGTNGCLWQAFWATTWQGPLGFGACGMASAPSVTSWGGDINVYWKGTDNNLHELWFSSGAWHGPVSLGMGPLDSAPAVASRSTGEQYLFWKSTEGNLRQAWFAGGQWNGPVSITGMGSLATAPTVTVRPNNEVHVFWKGTNGCLWQAFWATAWNGPQGFGACALGSAPVVTSRGMELDLFWRGGDASLQQMWFLSGQWNGPISLGMGPIPLS